MRKSYVKKHLSVAVILLFIGVAFAPSINANVSSLETVEITTEICGLNGGKHTIQLTKAEAEEVEHLFDSIRERLNATETREETEKIFNEAVVELDEYGLLGGLSVKQAQKLVNGEYQNRRVMKALEKLYSRNQELYDNNSNFLCLVAGRTTYTSCFGLVQTVLTAFFGALGALAFLIYSLFGHYYTLPEYFFVLFGILMFFSALNPLPYINPLAIGYLLGFGLIIIYPQGARKFIPSEGFINSYGLLGNKQWSGEFYGQGTYLPSILDPMWGSSPVGVTGFTGIKIMLEFENSDTFFLGFALQVNVKLYGGERR